MNSLERGGAAELAASLEVSPSYLSQLAAVEQISPVMSVKIEKATSGAVTRQEMRPDDWHLIWPEIAQVEN